MRDFSTGVQHPESSVTSLATPASIGQGLGRRRHRSRPRRTFGPEAVAASTSRKAVVRTSNVITHTDTCVKVAASSARHLTNTGARRLQRVTANSWCYRAVGWSVKVSAGGATSTYRRIRMQEGGRRRSRRRGGKNRRRSRALGGKSAR